MKNEELLKVLDQRNEDIKSLIDMQAKLTNAEIGAMNDVIKIKFEQVLTKQDQTNGSLGEHDKRIKELEDTTRPQGWAKKHWKAAMIIFLLGTYCLYLLYQIYSLEDLIKFLK